MTPRFSISFLRRNDGLLLLVHLHSHQRLLKTHNHLARPKCHLQGLVIACSVVEPRAPRLLLHRSVEDLSTRKPSKIVDRDRVSFLRLQLVLAHDGSKRAFQRSKSLTENKREMFHSLPPSFIQAPDPL